MYTFGHNRRPKTGHRTPERGAYTTSHHTSATSACWRRRDAVRPPTPPSCRWAGALGTECETDVVLGGVQGLHEGIDDAFRRTNKALRLPALYAGG